MPGLLDRWRKSAPAPEAKRLAHPFATYEGGPRSTWTQPTYSALAREGFQRNPVVHRCVRMIAQSAASVPWLVYAGEEELSAHPVLDLLARPNDAQDGASLFETLYGHLQVAGNAYLEAVTVDGRVRALHVLRPDRMRALTGPDGWVEAYDYRVGAEVTRFDQAGGEGGGIRPILHLALFNPLDDHYGLSPLEAASRALDLHNSAAEWNKALLDNAARPSGALVYTGPEGTGLSAEQHARLKADLEESFQGALNSGRPLLLDGGLDWKPLSMTPKDMDFQEARAGAARDIALAFGVPPMLLGLPGDNTYANYQEANRALWRQTLVPLVNRTAQALTRWLGDAHMATNNLTSTTQVAGAPIRIAYDLDAVDAMGDDRERLWSRIEAASFLSEDEKRAAVGYGPREGG